MSVPLFQIDAFADGPFTGNPAAVCLLDGPAPDDWLQAVAAELNLSETAFLWPWKEAWSLRWFTPTTEVDLCGHATLASAHALWAHGGAKPERVLAFDTRSGRLTARREGEAVVLDFPADPPEPCPVPEGLVDALGCPVLGVAHGRGDWLVEVADAAVVRRLRPDSRRLAEVPVPGVIVTAASDLPDADFVSRFFGPAIGIDEDPVTGSAHCILGPFWAERLGRRELVARQLSARGGRVGVRLRDDRVELVGRAVTVLEGALSAEAWEMRNRQAQAPVRGPRPGTDR